MWGYTCMRLNVDILSNRRQMWMENGIFILFGSFFLVEISLAFKRAMSEHGKKQIIHISTNPSHVLPHINHATHIHFEFHRFFRLTNMYEQTLDSLSFIFIVIVCVSVLVCVCVCASCLPFVNYWNDICENWKQSVVCTRIDISRPCIENWFK